VVHGKAAFRTHGVWWAGESHQGAARMLLLQRNCGRKQRVKSPGLRGRKDKGPERTGQFASQARRCLENKLQARALL